MLESESVMLVAWLAAGAALAFLVGSIPWGYVIGRAKGIDVRAHGSGNIGATNVGRLLGRGWGVLVFLLDALKGVAGVVCVDWLVEWLSAGALRGVDWRGIVFGVGAVLGHNFCPWLGWKGGKGIATSAGVLLAALPGAFLWAFGAWAVLFALTRIVSLASIGAAVVLAAAGMWRYGHGVLGWACLALAVLAVVRHRANIGRLFRGEEPRAFQKKKQEEAA
ncbi:MAG TPA: glycerol-3-phosphate 1-O-acyltransferase PlsY [Verrucomicrobiae bacterium]|nr:glycerol-3-phosphate 1-O-acyltransferase PlsY [Verrucomicrobiae bacterium]